MLVINSNDQVVNILKDFIISNEKDIYRFVYNYVQDYDNALDIIQEAVIKGLLNVHKLKEIQYLKTWFYRILINECLGYIKKNKKINIKDIDIFELDIPINDKGYNIDLYNAINKLKVDIKTVIILRFFEDMKIEDIAYVTNSNTNTVKTRLYKGLAQLKLDIEEEF